MSSPPVALPFELDSLSRAPRYQNWIYEIVAPYLGQSIFEAGAGIGNMSQWLPERKKLVVTEAEDSFIPVLKQKMSKVRRSAQVVQVNLEHDWVQSFVSEGFDTVVSFNLMEHIQDHESAFLDLARILSKTPGTRRIVTFVPAHQFAFGELDTQFKHFRRYNHKDFERLQAKLFPKAKLHFQYFNVVGLIGWIVMGRILRKKELGFSSVQSFEKLCPLIKPFDNWLHQNLRLPLGQSILAVFTFED